MKNPRLDCGISHNTPNILYIFSVSRELIINRRGFRLRGYSNFYEFFCETPEDFDHWISSLKKVAILSDISASYLFGKLIGRGNFAKVHVGKCKQTEITYAIKTIEKAKIFEHPRNLSSLEKEISIMRITNHHNIIKLYEVFESDLYIHMVIEYLIGGELLHAMQTKKYYSEKDAALAIKCVLEALEYLHRLNIIHRDLKPENLILVYYQISQTKKI